VVAPGDLAYRVAAAQYLRRTEALLTGFRSEARTGRIDVQFAGQARDLLTTTRLMLDSPAAEDPRLKSLLEDLELVLAQIAQVPRGSDRADLQLINQGLNNAACCCGCARRTPPGPAPCARKEHCDAGDAARVGGRRSKPATGAATADRPGARPSPGGTYRHGPRRRRARWPRRTRSTGRARSARRVGRARRPRCSRCSRRGRPDGRPRRPGPDRLAVAGRTPRVQP